LYLVISVPVLSLASLDLYKMPQLRHISVTRNVQFVEALLCFRKSTARNKICRGNNATIRLYFQNVDET